MVSVGNFYDAIEKIAPFSAAEPWDNVGLLVGGREHPAGRALVALDLTGPVLEEAKRLRSNLVITHHPAIFQPLKAVPAGHVVYKAIAAGISVICAHTNLDLAEGGVNDALAGRLGLREIRPFQPAGGEEPYRKLSVYVPAGSAEEVYRAMADAGAGREGSYAGCAFLAPGEGRFLPLEGAHPAIGRVGAQERVQEVRVDMLCAPQLVDAVVEAMKRAHPYEQPSYDLVNNHALTRGRWSLGRIGELPEALPPQKFAAQVRGQLGARGARFVAGGEPVRTVAVCGGSGGALIGLAKRMGAQALVTGEAKHDQLLEAGALQMTLVDAGHFATENTVVPLLCRRLRDMLPGAEIQASEACTDGMQYLA